ncbi:hypothetical protein V0M98_38530 (plasmid) [Pseudomonas silesiensis]|uniref:hypothetical protein n=1 Tax=Pseudomonas silesiensis TaxID=1853130 RepID=UPI0030D00F62
MREITMQRISAILLGSLLVAGCAPVQFKPTLLDPSKPNIGIPVVDKTSQLPPPIVMRGPTITRPKVVHKQAEMPEDLSQAKVFVPTTPTAQATFAVDVPPHTPEFTQPPAPVAVKQPPVASKAPAAAEPYDITASLERELAMEGHLDAPKATSKTTKAAQAPVKSSRKNEIDELTLRYAEGDVKASYTLAKLLYQEQRSEEADTVLDFAARNNHVPSMLLYSERLQKLGKKDQSRHWLKVAADAGSKEAKQKLAQ